MEFTVWIAAFIGVALEYCDTSAIIELRLVRYDINNGTIAGGSNLCCDAGAISKCPLNECDPYFYICIQDVRHLSGCKQGELKTSLTENEDHVQFKDRIGTSGTPNPIVFHNPEYSGVIIPKITVYDEDKRAGAAQDDKIDYMQHVHTFPPDYNNNRTHVYKFDMQGQVSKLHVELNVRCDTNFYGNDCKKYCEPDDQSYCDNNGKLVCIPGKMCDPNRTPRTPKPTTPTTTTSPIPTTSTAAVTLRRSTKTLSAAATTTRSTKSSSRSTTTTGTVTIIPPSSDKPPAITPTAIKSTPTITADIVCVLQNYTGNKKGVYQLSVSKATNLANLQAYLVSGIASLLSVSKSDIQVNSSIRLDTDIERVYHMMFYKTGSHQAIGTAISSPVVRGLCRSSSVLQKKEENEPDHSGGNRIALIAGLVSAILLTGGLVPALFLLYRRKCRRSQVNDGDTKTITNKT